MDAQRIAVDAVVALTDCDREKVDCFHPPALPGRREGSQAPDLQGPAGTGTGLNDAATPFVFPFDESPLSARLRCGGFLAGKRCRGASGGGRRDQLRKPSISACRLVVKSGE